MTSEREKPHEHYCGCDTCADEIERLRSILLAIRDHATEVWPPVSEGRALNTIRQYAKHGLKP